MSLKSQAELLSLNRSGLYYRPLALSSEEITLKHRIDEIYTLRPFYGSRRIAATLQREGWQLNRKAVQRHMREMGIAGISPGPNLSKRRADHKVYPYLLRGLVISKPNQVWGYRRHLHPAGTWVAVPGSGARLVLPLCRELGA